MTQGDDEPNQQLPNSNGELVVTPSQNHHESESDGIVKAETSVEEVGIVTSVEELVVGQDSEAEPSEQKSKRRKRAKEAVQDVEAPGNFPVCSIQIGSWKRDVVKYYGDMKFKCYFKKKRFLWEVLDDKRQRKVEYEWDGLHLISLKEDLDGGELQLLVTKIPTFFHEKKLQPRKHPDWVSSKDFTNNNASTNMLHVLRFTDEVYAKLYKRIMAVAEVKPELRNLIWSPERKNFGVKQQMTMPNVNFVQSQRTQIPYPRCQVQHHPLQVSQPCYNNIIPPQTSAPGLNTHPELLSRWGKMQHFNVSNPIQRAYHQQQISFCAPSSNPPFQAPFINTNRRDYGNVMVNHNAAGYYNQGYNYQQAISPPMDGIHTAPSTSDSKDENGQNSDIYSLRSLCGKRRISRSPILHRM